jgi:hypothetical protein
LLNHPTLDRLRELGLDGMAKGFCDLAANPESRALEHAEWLGLLVEQEATLRQQKRFEARARRQAAPCSQRRRCGFPDPARSRPGAVPASDQLRLDP